MAHAHRSPALKVGGSLCLSPRQPGSPEQGLQSCFAGDHEGVAAAIPVSHPRRLPSNLLGAVTLNFSLHRAAAGFQVDSRALSGLLAFADSRLMFVLAGGRRPVSHSAISMAALFHGTSDLPGCWPGCDSGKSAYSDTVVSWRRCYGRSFRFPCTNIMSYVRRL